jgi:alkylation response protein AidB-like acyl-CoA dehydrogenase
MPPRVLRHPLVISVREFVAREVQPVASELEHADRFPHALVARLAEMGLFGALVPSAWGGLGLDVTTYAHVIEELCRGWMSLAGVLNSHTMAALIVLHHGTEEQRQRFLPRFARAEARGGLALTEPQAGSDVQAIRTRAARQGDVYLMNGTKMFVTNGREGNTFALLAVTDPAARPRHRGMSCFIVEKEHPGLRVSKSIAKLGYKGVDTAELVLDNFPVPAANLVGGIEGRGFRHVMSGLETGRINIAARAVGVAQAAYEAACVGGRPDEAPPALADMAARVEAARLLTDWAAGLKDKQERCDLEAGMAKLCASETAQAVAEEAMRIVGEPALVTSSAVERLYRDTPLMIIGEGTNEIQRTLIARQLVHRYGERLGALVSRDGEREDRRQMVLAVRQFVEKEVVPVTAELERAGRYPEAVLRNLADLGLFGALVPQAEGGLGLDLVTYAMLVEELARGWTTVAGAIVAHASAARSLAQYADKDARTKFLPAMARGELVASTALAGDIASRRDGGGWVLTGTIALVDNAPRAGLLVVLSGRTTPQPALFLVQREARGVRVGSSAPTLGGRGLDPAPVVFDDAPAAALLGAHDAAASAVAVARLGLAASAVGLGQAAFEAALRYAQQRTAFGHPICEHQAIQLKLADMATAITAARLLTIDAAGRLETGDDVPAGLARLYAGQMLGTVTLESMRIHGGYGYTAEFPVERYYRDVPRLALALGGPERERAELARRLLNR